MSASLSPSGDHEYPTNGPREIRRRAPPAEISQSSESAPDSAVAAAPTVLPMVLGVWWKLPLVTTLGTLLGLVYAAVLFTALARYAGQVLTMREAEVLAAASLER